MPTKRPVDDLNLEGIDVSKHDKLMELMTNSFRVAEVDGRRILQSPDGEFLEYVLMDQSYFNENWLTQFALGYVGEHNYFDMTAWSDITLAFTKGVIVIDNTGTPVLVIRKFTDINMTGDGQAWMNYYGGQVAKAKHAIDEHERDEMISNFAKQIEAVTKELGSPNSNDLTSMIPDRYYKENGVDVTTMKQVIYIRDTYKLGGNHLDPDGEVINRVEKVLSKWNNQRVVSDQDKKFILEVTSNEFIFDSTQDKVEPNNSESPAPVNTAPAVDPFAD